MRVVQPLPAGAQRLDVEFERPGRLVRGGCAPELDEEAVRGVAELEVGVVYRASLSEAGARTRPR